MSLKGKRVGFVGGGNMGEALIRGLLGTNLVPAELLSATDVRAERPAQLTAVVRDLLVVIGGFVGDASLFQLVGHV